MHDAERSFAAPGFSTDEQLNYWGCVYIANAWIAAAGVSFEDFLLRPVEILFLYSKRGSGFDVRRQILLPARRADQVRAVGIVQARAEADLEREHVERRGGAWFAKLRHHAMP